MAILGGCKCGIKVGGLGVMAVNANIPLDEILTLQMKGKNPNVRVVLGPLKY